MAEVSQMEKLKDETTCCKCQRQYSQPKLLPCLHSVCSSCLVVRSGVREAEGLKYMVTCPQCGADAELPKTGIFSLPTSFFKVHMAECYQRLLEEEAGGCQECGEESHQAKAVAYCRDCDHVMCRECEERHHHMKSLSGHWLESLEEHKHNLLRPVATTQSLPSDGPAATTQSLPSDGLPFTLLCQKHGKHLNVYCRTCSTLVCSECTKTDHVEPRHKLGFVQTLVKHQKAELAQSMGVVREMQATAAQAISSAESRKELIAKQEEELCSTINESFAELARKLDECRKKLISRTQDTVASHRSRVDRHLETLETKASELENLVQVCEQSLEHANDQEFMALRRNLTTRIKEVCVHWHESVSKMDNDDSPCITLPFSTAFELVTVLNSHTNDHLTLSHSKSTLSGAQVEVGKAACLTVHTRYANGKPCMEKVDLEVEVSLPRTGESIPVILTSDDEPGSYKIAFLPDTRGQYKVSVKFGGEDISNSPRLLCTAPSIIGWEEPTRVIENHEWPWAVACCNNRQIYITKNYHHTIAVLDQDGQLIRSVGLKGQRPGQLWSPTGIAVDDQAGAIYVADGLDSGRLQKFSLNGQLLAIFTELVRPCGVLLSKCTGLVYVCDRQNRRIVVLNKELKLVNVFGELSQSINGFQEITGTLSAPHSLAEDADGNIYVTDSDKACVLVFDPEGAHIQTIQHPHSDMFGPSGICVQGDWVYVADCGNHQVVVFQKNGQLVNSYGRFGQMEGQFYTPLGLAIDKDGYLYVCDHCNARVQVF